MESQPSSKDESLRQAQQARLAESMREDVLSGERDKQVNEMRAGDGLGPWHELPSDDLRGLRHPKIARFFEILDTAGASRVVGPSRRK